MLRAIADGLIDTRNIDLRDPGKVMLAELLMMEQLRREQKELQWLLWIRNILLRLDLRVDADTYKARAKREEKAFDELVHVLLDSDDATSEEERNEQMKAAIRRGWETRFGGLDRKETQQNIDKVAEGLRKMRLRNARRTRQPK